MAESKRQEMDPKQLERPMRLVRNLIERLRADSKDDPKDEPEMALIFTRKGLGGLGLSRREAEMYFECLDSLVEAAHGKLRDQATVSRDALDDQLRTAVLKALARVSPGASQRDAAFASTVERVIEDLRDFVLQSPLRWTLVVPVRGIAPAVLPLEFGRVTFEQGNRVTTRRATAALLDFEPPLGTPMDRVKSERKARRAARDRLARDLSGAAIGTVVVVAIDAAAARAIGVEEVRRTVDVVNFFAPFFAELPSEMRASVAPETNGLALVTVAAQPDSGAFHTKRQGEASPVMAFHARSARARKVGVTRSDELLRKTALTDLDGRILTALSWAGRARVRSRRDEAFAFYAIALEALLTNPNSRTGVTKDLQLRVAHLVGVTLEARKRIYETVGRTYGLRSKLVHGGDSTAISENDLKTIRQMTERAITIVLTEPTFMDMRNGQEFEAWFGDALLNPVSSSRGGLQS